MEPPVSINADTLLNSRIFLPVAGVQPAALAFKELVEEFFEGSCQAKRTMGAIKNKKRRWSWSYKRCS